MRVLPFFGCIKKGFNFFQSARIKGVLGLGFGQYIPPCAKVMKRNAMIAQCLFGLRKYAIVKDDRCVRAGGAGFVDRIDEAEL